MGNPGESLHYENRSSGNSSSDEDQQVSDFESLFDLPKQSKSGSSSDSSSSIKSYRSKGSKKSKSKGSRDHDSLRTQLISQKNFYENKFKEMDSSLKKMSEINEKILANQIKEEEIKTANKNKFKEMNSSINQITQINEKILANQNKKEEKVAKLEI